MPNMICAINVTVLLAAARRLAGPCLIPDLLYAHLYRTRVFLQVKAAHHSIHHDILAAGLKVFFLVFKTFMNLILSVPFVILERV